MTKLANATIPVEEASVQERQVTVQVLTIGTKQVTQSLYKQLVSEQVIDVNGNLKGTVWGWVNLHKDCLNEDHLHVIWEDNGQLKRSYTPWECRIYKGDVQEKWKQSWYAIKDAGQLFIAVSGVWK